MKKKILFGMGIMTICVMILFNVSLIAKSIGDGNLNLTTLVKIAKADEELPPVIIECDREYGWFSGVCWELKIENLPLGEYYCYCEWSGSMTNNCTYIMEGICNL